MITRIGRRSMQQAPQGIGCASWQARFQAASPSPRARRDKFWDKATQAPHELNHATKRPLPQMIADVVREPSVVAGGSRHGRIRWRCGQDTATIEYSVELRSVDHGCLWLWYCVRGVPIHLAIRLVSTAIHLGGRRWWFTCPGTGERVGKLYLPPAATQFAGRRAHDLTYTSYQESGRDKRFRRKIAKLLGTTSLRGIAAELNNRGVQNPAWQG
jgi:hypothetical protein